MLRGLQVSLRSGGEPGARRIALLYGLSGINIHLRFSKIGNSLWIFGYHIGLIRGLGFGEDCLFTSKITCIMESFGCSIVVIFNEDRP